MRFARTAAANWYAVRNVPQLNRNRIGEKTMTRILFQSVSIFVLGLSVAIYAVSQERVVTVPSETKWHRHAVDNAYMNKRISDAAEQYKEYAPIPRIAFFDIGYPKDRAEFAELNGYGILLVSALSQDPKELPIKRAYVEIGGKQIELKPVKEISVRNQDLTSQVVKTFGEYRTDVLFLIPIYLRFQQGDVLIDFAFTKSNRQSTRRRQDECVVPIRECLGVTPQTGQSLLNVAAEPSVIAALNPYFAYKFVAADPSAGFFP